MNEETEKVNNTANNSQDTKPKEVCQKDKEDCMFGCSKDTSVVVEEEKKEPVKTDLKEMMKIVEETEKICDQIEEKDRERKEREERDSLMKQIELNKKFLVQQKAQDKQIKDLEEIVKSMSFTHEMNKAVVEKCGKSQDDCLTDKEKALKKLLLEKQKNTRSVHINLNFKDFGKEFIKHLTEKLGLTSEEMRKFIVLLNSGELNIDELKRQLGFGNQNFNRFSSFSAEDLPRQRFLDKANNQCHTCKVDLSEYIDRCKIPCRK